MTNRIDIGTNRQLLFDDRFIESSENIEHVMHEPTLTEVVLDSDRPWESGGVHYSSVVQDGDTFKMWYRADTGGDPASAIDSESWICYAESNDGITWTRPNLGIVDQIENGKNNILFPDKASGINPTVILDPSADASERYKMITRGSGPACVLGYVSGDGISWKQVGTDPFLSEPGPFDSHNTLVYDDETDRYVIFCRGVDTNRRPKGSSPPGIFKDGIRAIRRSESPNFRDWSDMTLVVTADDDDPSDYHLYTNAAIRYTRAQAAWFMFPMILYVDREGNANSYPGLSDVQLVTSRDGIAWDRRFRRPFMSPDHDARNWVDRNPIVGVGLLQTSNRELSLYYSELLRCDDCRFRRATIRTDGFVSLRGPYAGWGEFATPAMTTNGRKLVLNFRTTGGGAMSVELLDASGCPMPGYTADDCDPLFGDHIEKTVTWNSNQAFDLSDPFKIRFAMRDSDLFSFKFNA